MSTPARAVRPRPACRSTWVLILLVGTLTSVRGGSLDASSGAEPGVRIRQPVALVWTVVDGRERLLAANRRSGSISVIDPATRRVVAEVDVGLGLADLAAVPGSGGRRWLAVDQAAHDLLLLEFRPDRLEIRARIHVSTDPVRVSLSGDGRSCVVASRWSRRLTFLDLGQPDARDAPAPRMVRTLELPFSPRELARSDDGALLAVADAFGGRLALVDLKESSLRRVFCLPMHQIRGLVPGPDTRSLVVAHQSLSALARTAFDDIHWGLLLGNQLQALPWASLQYDGTGVPSVSASLELGDIGRGAADPSALLVDRRGRLIVALAGVGEIAIVERFGARPRRIAVGRRPVALASSPDGALVSTADASDETISVVDVDEGRRVAAIPLGPRPAPDLVERGERLFHDARLSHDGWMSCQSCHTDGHTTGLLADTLGDGSYGAPKKIPSLLGVGSTGPWNWTGSAARLEDQVRRSIATTMQAPRSAFNEDDIAALAAYLRSLKPPSALDIERSRPENPAVARGREVFAAQRCGACHAPPDYTAPAVFDVGLADEIGNRRFNPPSLRGVGLREPLLHDGRARTLEEVFERHHHPAGRPLPPAELADLVAFLKTL